MRSTQTLLMFFGVMAMTIFAVIVVFPSDPGRYLPGDFWPQGKGLVIGSFDRSLMRLGLDLRGGTYLVLEADPPPDYKGKLSDAVEGAKRVVERRVNSLGVSEAEVQTSNGNRIVVSIPGVSKDEAEKQVGRTAALNFMSYDDSGNLVPATGVVDGKTVPMTGSLLQNNTTPVRQTTTNAVQFQTTGDGSKLLGQITTKALKYPSTDQRNLLVIELDGQIISSANVQGVITDQGVITGQPTFSDSKDLSDLLNSGALPVPLKTIQSQEVSATLGDDSVVKSVQAGEVGLLAVMLFMILYYRLPGVLASAALIVYTCLTLMVYKLWPVTLTLSGIAAFVLSVGIAVDANILIFERMKEELRRGRTLHAAIDIGFRRAWPSIRDSNVSTLITCLILYYFGSKFGTNLVKGFALTLAVGVGVSMFSAITVTRTFLKMVLGTPLASRHWLFNADEVHRAGQPSRAA
ncbi:MAG: protein translocase subunit SecD, partial [Tepidiformaceae bacterium]